MSDVLLDVLAYFPVKQPHPHLSHRHLVNAPHRWVVILQGTLDTSQEGVIRAGSEGLCQSSSEFPYII